MSIQLSDNITVGQQLPLESKYFNGTVPYIDVAQAESLLTIGIRYRGLTVNINGVEYWFKDGIANGDLVIKTPSLTGYVPYTGATTNVNLGAFDLTATKITGTVDAIINGATVGLGSGNFSTNIAFGSSALSSNTTGTRNVAIGGSAMRLNTTGRGNLAIGDVALEKNIIGIGNLAIGSFSLQDNLSNYNTAIGYGSMFKHTTGEYNISFGYNSMQQSITGAWNVAIGTANLFYSSGDYNVAIGGVASRWITSGSNNTAIGSAAGSYIIGGVAQLTSADNSIFIGFNTKALANSQTNQIVIGYDETGLGSNTTIIGNSSTVTTALRGNLLLGSTVDTGERLQVTGTANISSTVTIGSLSGVGSRMVVADALGVLSTSAIPVGTVTSVGLSMPSAFTVANSPVTGADTLTVTGAGLATQYIRGDGQLANFPSTSGGGSSVAYYLNGSVSQGTFGGDVYYQLSKTPIFGAGTNFTRTSGAGDGYIASFISDAGDPSLLSIPAGNWTLQFYFNASSNGGNPRFYGELYKVDSSNVFTLIASESANPEFITNGTAIDQYFTSISVPQTTLLITDRIAIRIYVIPTTRNITLHTEGTTLSEVLTTFSTGLTVLNGLTEQVQFFATGTSGTDFGINSTGGTHTFNLPTASATNRGALSSADWTTFNGKFTLPSLTAGSVLFSNGTTIAQDNANLFWDDTNNRLGIGNASPAYPLDITGVIRGTSDAIFNSVSVGKGPNSLTYNTVVGELALNSITTGDFNLAFGYQSQRDTTTGSNNVSFGFNSLALNVGGIGNTAFGTNTLRDNSGAGSYNTAIGLNASLSNISGVGNLSIGNEALLNNSAGSYNIAFGYRAGRYFAGNGNLTSINNSILIGSDTKALANNQTNQIVIGYNETGLGSNTTIIGNSSTITTAIRGNLLLGTTTDAGFLLNVQGTARVVGNLTLGSEIFGVSNTYFNGPTVNTGTLHLRFATVNLPGGTFSSSMFTTGSITVNSSANTVGLITSSSGVTSLRIENTKSGGGIWYFENNRNAVAGSLEITNSIGAGTPCITLSPTRNVGIGTYTPAASAILDITSTTKGFLPPRMSTTDRGNIIAPATGLQIYNTDTNVNEYWNGTAWVAIGAGTGGGGGASALFNYYNFI